MSLTLVILLAIIAFNGGVSCQLAKCYFTAFKTSIGSNKCVLPGACDNLSAYEECEKYNGNSPDHQEYRAMCDAKVRACRVGDMGRQRYAFGGGISTKNNTLCTVPADTCRRAKLFLKNNVGIDDLEVKKIVSLCADGIKPCAEIITTTTPDKLTVTTQNPAQNLVNSTSKWKHRIQTLPSVNSSNHRMRVSLEGFRSLYAQVQSDGQNHYTTDVWTNDATEGPRSTFEMFQHADQKVSFKCINNLFLNMNDDGKLSCVADKIGDSAKFVIEKVPT